MTLRRLSSLLVPATLVLGCAKADRAGSPKNEPVAPGPVEVPQQQATASATPTPTPAPGSELDKRSEAQSSFASIDEAEKALDRAKSDLDVLLAGARGGPGGGATPLASGDPRCPNACKAFSSLKRAADAICRLAGSTDSRCSRAKTMVDENEKRVSACKCE